MSDRDPRFDPAIGLLEFESIVAGLVAGDAMVKAAPVASLFAGTVHPGHYLVLVGGDTASVDIAIETGRDRSPLDELFLPDAHPTVLDALTSTAENAPPRGDALGIVETTTAAASIVAGDAGAKASAAQLMALRVSDGLGGKAYCLFGGDVADVEVSVESAVAAAEPRAVQATVIPQLHDDLRRNLDDELRFNRRLRGLGSG